jgi:HK97 family phage prohead protease
MTFTPRGWDAAKIAHRFAGGSPTSYNEADHSCEAVISAGAKVSRFYGQEILEISRKAVDLSRVPVPLLDSHNQASIDNVLGVIDSAWISDNKLFGKIRFAQTPKGIRAEGMVKRGEISGISAGYAVSEWRVTDADGDVVEEDHIHWSDDLTFTAVRWELYEASLTGIPADIASAIRSAGGRPNVVADTRARMMARERMAMRERMSRAQTAMRND